MKLYKGIENPTGVKGGGEVLPIDIDTTGVVEREQHLRREHPVGIGSRCGCCRGEGEQCLCPVYGGCRYVEGCSLVAVPQVGTC